MRVALGFAGMGRSDTDLSSSESLSTWGESGDTGSLSLLPLSLLLLDIGVAEDGWPPEPDGRRELLAEVASVFLNECRDIDILARYTPTVFLFLLPGTGAEGAAALCRRMLDSLCSRSFASGVDLEPVAGIITVPRADLPNPRKFLSAAEACLALAQRGHGERGLCATWE